MRFAYIIALLILTLAIAGCAAQEITTADERAITAPTTKVVRETTPEVQETAPAPTKTVAKAATPAETSMSFEEEEAKAVGIVKEFVKNLDGYKNQQGRELEVKNIAKTSCEGCWVMDVAFTRDLLYYPDKMEYIKMHVDLKKWKVETYTFG